jgi:ADP-dependent NAD(P)H-hydrate dehydratase / NAD(P)H-hydrate epimerase
MISLLSCSLLSAEDSRALDKEARDEWGFNVFSLIEAAGRLCAEIFVRHFGELFKNNTKISVFSGTGNNGADAMVTLRSWILSGLVEASNCALVVSRLPKSEETGPWTETLKSLEKMRVPVFVWNGETEKNLFRNSDLINSDLIIDGIAGTGVSGPLRGVAQEMVHAINSQKTKKPLVVSVDIPSGNSDEWKPGMPIVEADFTLAIEPRKRCIYIPAARPYAGIILPVNGIFPKEIINSYRDGNRRAELLDWESARLKVPKVKAHAHKYEKGCVEIRAGSTGTTGAALIAARGAQAAGAGLVRLVVDDDIYPILASGAGGIMVSPVSGKFQDFEGKFTPDAILLGPGWGRAESRAPVLEKALRKEKTGTPLILDADAIELSKNAKFNGNAILTPHPGELSGFSGIEKEDLLCRPAPALLKLSREYNAVILFKSHVLYIAAPDGRLGIVDGMAANLAAGGSGDLLAGICAGIAARMAREERGFDAYNCAAAAASLLIAVAKADNLRKRFTDPLELADKAAELAGEAWLNGTVLWKA